MRPSRVAVLSLVAVAMKFGLNLALVKSYGLVGLAWATVIVAAFTTAVRYALALRPVDSTPPREPDKGA